MSPGIGEVDFGDGEFVDTKTKARNSSWECLLAQLNHQGPGFNYIKQHNIDTSWHHIPMSQPLGGVRRGTGR